MMGTTAALVLQLAIAALEHATELNQLLATANAAGRDVTADELGALRTKASMSVDALMAAIAAAQPATPAA